MRHGETGTKFFVIRYGKVRVMRPLPDGGMVEVCILRRGQFVGERTLITGRDVLLLRSAFCEFRRRGKGRQPQKRNTSTLHCGRV